MIHVYGNYYIESDEHQFIVCTPRKPREGKQYYSYLTFHPTLASAICGVRNRMYKDEIKGQDMELTEAIYRLQEIDERLANILSEKIGSESEMPLRRATKGNKQKGDNDARE